VVFKAGFAFFEFDFFDMLVAMLNNFPSHEDLIYYKILKIPELSEAVISRGLTRPPLRIAGIFLKDCEVNKNSAFLEVWNC
jgi:hypothetical protein